MNLHTSAAQRWGQLDGTRRGFIGRCEKYAAFTLPKLCLPDGYDQNSDELQHDYQSLGAQAVNHLANKIMLALFAPSRPFFRLDADAKMIAEMQDALGDKFDQTKLNEALAQGEKSAVAELDRLALRPNLYEAIKHLIVIGNTLLELTPDGLKVFGIKKYCVRRSATGKVIEILIAEKMLFDELEPSVQEQLRNYPGYGDRPDREVTHYRWLIRNRDGSYSMTQWVDVHRLPKQFDGKWPEASMPFHALTWDLSSDANYGTGLVEDNQGDFSCLSTLSQSQVMGAVLVSEFRWLVNPGGMTKVDDLMESANGAALPGMEGDISIIETGKSRDLKILLETNSIYVNRLGRSFLMGSAVTRDAERVTAEEIRMQANELETAYGGVYSRLAVDIQLPLAGWLMKRVGLGVPGSSGVRPTIVTGLEALSRQGDLENLRMWLADLAALATLPPGLQARLRWDKLASELAAPRRVVVAQFFKSDAEIQQEMQAAQQQELQGQAALMGAQSAADQAAAKAKQET